MALYVGFTRYFIISEKVGRCVGIKLLKRGRSLTKVRVLYLRIIARLKYPRYIHVPVASGDVLWDTLAGLLRIRRRV